MLKVNEIFYSIQGEGTAAGLPCIFVRLTYCNLRCTYCDTEYAFYEGEDKSVEQIITHVRSFGCNLVEITGGEPLMQEESKRLMEKLCDEGFEVLLETGGSLPIGKVDRRVKVILDFKCPTSGMEKKNLYSNIDSLKLTDEVKFVIGNREDYDWTKNLIAKYDLDKKAIILFSTVFGKIEFDTVVSWILKDNLNVRFQLQMHKFIWNPEKRGV